MTITDTLTLSNGTKIPLLGLGTWRLSDGEEVENAVKTALQIGYRHIDTATVYRNETGVGRAIRQSGVPRSEIFVTTKVWNDDHRLGYDGVLRAFDASLQRLGMDYVDLYLVHWPVKGMYKQAWRALESIYASGRAKAIGVSNFMEHHLRDLLPEAKVKPMVNQFEFHPWLQSPGLLEMCRKENIVPTAWSPLMQGKLDEEPELGRIAAEHGKTPAQVVLRWMLQKRIVTIPKSSRPQRIAENAALYDFALTDQQIRRIDALDRGRRIGPDPDNFSF